MHILIAALHRPTKPTGVCRHAVNLAKCLAITSQVDKITLVIGVWQLDYFKTAFVLDSPKINLIPITIKNNSVTRNIWFLWGLSKLTNKINPDIIHLSFPIPFFRSLFYAPVVSTIHDFYPYECPENFGYPKVLLNRSFLKQCIKNSDGLSCVSQITLKNLYRYFPDRSSEKTTTVIYNYVDFSKVTPSIPKNIDLEKSDQFILCVGQHRRNKNIDLLIRTYSVLINEQKILNSTKLVIVGSFGPETNKFKELIAQLSIAKKVILLSSIDDAQLCWLYQNCEVFVISSSTEGFCLPLAEALYFSCKVVCSNIPIFREICDTKCNFFDLEENKTDSSNNLSSAIVRALKQPNDKYSGFEFSKSTIAHQCLQFYSQILGTKI
ncbi:glycosyltransferase family 1 protein [Myxosarcina sp. GI1]|uniref:glycosyltransferase family 4 protein n=1 Tax=Myxosarcina sp. GI1 TaxID=1541065 RepID=UPI00056BC78C|nr:glycosyltransferase family 1 protein [Myxosarcina sp. GI1]